MTLPTFTDAKGRSWNLQFDVGLARRIRKLKNIDFVNAHDGKAVAAVSRDDELLVDCIWLLCEDQAVAAGIDSEDFGRGLGGDALGAAGDALLEALVLFSQPARRPAMQALLAKAKEAAKSETDLIVEKVNSDKARQAIQNKRDQLSQEIDGRLDRLISGRS